MPVAVEDKFLAMARELAGIRPGVTSQSGGFSPSAQPESYARDRLGIAAAVETNRVTLRAPFSQDQFQGALYAIYRQIFGNTYVMASERPTYAELQLRNGNVTVRGFIRLLAKSEVYKTRFLYKASQNRLIELNHKLLLGRSPYDQKEIGYHLDLYIKEGYDAEIDSYLDSAEYLQAFGEDTVPFFRGFKYQVGQSAASYPWLLNLYDGFAGSDTDRSKQGQAARLNEAIATQEATPVERKLENVWKEADPTFQPISKPVDTKIDGMLSFIGMARQLTAKPNTEKSPFLDMARELTRNVPMQRLTNFYQPPGLPKTSNKLTETGGQERIRAVAALETPRITLRGPFTESELQVALYQIYRQVFGNTYIMESERPKYAELQLRNGNVTVRGFIRLLAKSEVYKTRFFYKTSHNRFTELNFKLLLGRAPYEQKEIGYHLDLYTKSGYDADIDSYIDSPEYLEAYGEDTVPFFRGFKYQVGQVAQGFPRFGTLYDGFAGSDTDRNMGGQVPRLTTNIARGGTGQEQFLALVSDLEVYKSQDKDTYQAILNQVLGTYTRPSSYQQTETFAQERIGAVAALETPRVTLRAPFDNQEFEGALYAIYRQIFGNTYVMASERPKYAELQLRNGNVTVRGFVRLLAKSEVYKSRFLYKSSQNRLIELNHKLLLGRAPYDQTEIRSHLDLYIKEGYDAEIDSYLDSEEYLQAFGEYTVPFFRGFKYQVGQSAPAFPRFVELYDGFAGSDTDRNQAGQVTRLTQSLALVQTPETPSADRDAYRASLLATNYTQPSVLQQSETFGQDKIRATEVLQSPKVVLNRTFSETELQAVFYAIYKQVFGNTYVMESERPVTAELQLRNGNITVRGFIRLVAKSPAYKTRFFFPNSQNRFIELNHKLLLGRAPYDQAEVSKHVAIYINEGYDAEIDSYLDSPEYLEAYGEDTVPFPRGFKYQVGQTNLGFTGYVSLWDGDAGSDTNTRAERLTTDIARTVREEGAEVRVDQIFNQLSQPSPYRQPEGFGQDRIRATAVLERPTATLRKGFTEQELQGVLYAIYKQVFGNNYVTEAERPVFAESQLRDGKLTVRGFIRQIAKSEAYKTRFFFPNSQNRFIELNHKLLLGRAPYDQAEISKHVAIYTSLGYDAEIDSYLDSAEYLAAFGEETVPSLRGFKTQSGQTTEAFNRLVTLWDGDATSDTSTRAERLTESLNRPTREEGLESGVDRVLDRLSQPSKFQQTETFGQDQIGATETIGTTPVSLRAPFTEEQFQGALNACYQQVFGRTYVMESERPIFAESQLRDGKLSIRGFVRVLAKSEVYKTRFFYPSSQIRFIELNHKLLLGRAPYNQAEVSMHVDVYNAQGYEAEIDSYLDSAEYLEAFGEETVPYLRGFKSQPGQSTKGFTRMTDLYDGYAASDTDRSDARLTTDIYQGPPSPPADGERDSFRAQLLASDLNRPSYYQQPENYGQERIRATAVLEKPKVTLLATATELELQGTIYAVYQQVLGKTHVMESEKLTFAESQLRDGKLTVRGFVRLLAKSEAYKTRFFYTVSQNRFIELNHKLLLGRAPYNQPEVSQHISLYANEGYEAEIDSYLDSEEYLEAFGEDTVPYLRGFTSQPGQTTEAFNRMVELYDGYAASDTDTKAERLTEGLIQPQQELLLGTPQEQILNQLTRPSSLGQSETYGQDQIGATEAMGMTPVSLRAPFTEEQFQGVLNAAYQQVFGKTHVMESERPVFAESQLRDGKLSVRGFVRVLAKSEVYKTRFFYPLAQVRFIELNHKLLLGRAPYDQAEVSMHVDLYNAQGYDAEIDSYLDSAEYLEVFGEETVPYLRGFKSQPGQSTKGFTRMTDLYDGYAASDTDRSDTRLTDSF